MPTLGMHIIAGRGDAVQLERCLKSLRGPLFDQIVVGVNGDDQAVFEVARKYAQVVDFGPWREDFSAARNHALSFLTTTHAFWVDSDDVIKQDDYQKLLELKKELDSHEVIYLKYVYSHDSHGGHGTILPRERIWHLKGGYRWDYPIHECVWHDTSKVHRREDIEIHHYPSSDRANMDRNLRILEREWAKPVKNSRMAFYYARDLLDSGKWEKGEPVALECVENGLVMGGEKAGLCRSLAHRYFAMASDDKRSPGEREENRVKTERIAFIGIQADHAFAELWTYLGCVAYDRHDETRAILCFETALGCLREAAVGSMSQYYSLVPARNLYMIYYYRGEYSKALMFNKLVLEAEPSDAQARENRDLTWKQWFGKYPPLVPVAPGIQSVERLPGQGGVRIPAGNISIAWLIPWFNMDDPATRIRRVNVSQKLEQMGVDSTVIHSYLDQPIEKTLKEIRDASACVFTQVTLYDLDLMRAVKAAGKKVILDSCEAIFGVPGQREAWGLADKVVCCSTKLADLHQEKGMVKVAVVRDAVEVGL